MLHATNSLARKIRPAHTFSSPNSPDSERRLAQALGHDWLHRREAGLPCRCRDRRLQTQRQHASNVNSSGATRERGTYKVGPAERQRGRRREVLEEDAACPKGERVRAVRVDGERCCGGWQGMRRLARSWHEIVGRNNRVTHRWTG